MLIDGEPYKRLTQQSSSLCHGLWGAHVVHEPLYRRDDVRNGPTIHPLEAQIGIVDGSLLPDLTLAAGGLAAVQTTREVEVTLERLGFRWTEQCTEAAPARDRDNVVDIFVLDRAAWARDG